MVNQRENLGGNRGYDNPQMPVCHYALPSAWLDGGSVVVAH
jgi:hypothetical protein